MWHSYKITESIKINEMYSFFEVHYGHNYFFPGESHNFWECMYIIDGNVCVSGDERVYNMKKNEIIFHKPLEVHKFQIDSTEGAHLLIFSFSMGGKLSNFFENKVFFLNSEQINIISALLRFMRNNIIPDTKSGDCSMYIKKFDSSATYSQMVVSYIYQLFLSLCVDSTVSDAAQTGDAKIFSDAVNYMSGNINAMPGIKEIAESCNISQTGLKRIFTKYSGISVHKYFLMMKINTAAHMINENMSITEISEKLGFSSQAYFSFVFKRETGFSPSEYKIRHKNSSKYNEK